MSQFSFEDYKSVVNKAQSGSTPSAKIGFFKLGADGAQALVRVNCAKADDLQFATIHKPVYGKKYEGLSNPFAGISCLNPLGSYGDDCPLCKAAAQEGALVGKATKQVYVQMLVSYKDAVTGTYTAVQPVIWERPAGFSKELATKISTYGDLSKVMFIVTRNGTGKDTRYSFDLAPSEIFKPEMIPADFSAFNGFKINKHSYWEKTVDEINTFLATGSFPASEKEDATETPVAAAPAASVASTPVAQPAPAPAPAPTPTVAPAAKPATATKPTGGFSF